MNWFSRKGFLFYPISRIGWIILTIVIAYLVYAFLNINMQTDSIGDALMSWSFNALVAFAIYSFVAYLTTVKKN